MRQEREFAYEVYPKRDITIVRGEGATLFDNHGQEYIDCVAGIGVANIGHANPKVVEAIRRQSETLITCPGIFFNDRRGELMEKLVSITPASLNRVFLCNSGTEAVEAAMKFARVSTGKNGFISAMRGFHGRTMGALSATFKYRNEFEPLLPGHKFVPFGNLEKLTDAIDDDTAAVLLEVVQGEGGVRLADADYFQQVQHVCATAGVLLIVDEVQTGFARTGKMFACEHYGIEPDIMTLAKGIGGGVPLGAVMCTEHLTSSLGKHGSTFGGNPLACAASLATIDFIIEHDLAVQAKQKGDYLVSLIKASAPSSVREIRHLGLMIGIELKMKSRPIIDALMAQHVLALPAGTTVLRLLPPLTISYQQLDTLAERIIDVLQLVANNNDAS